jgi:hypothetical protein
MNGPVASNLRSNPVWGLVFLAMLMAVMYLCMCTLHFTHDSLDIAFVCLFYFVPVFAIWPALCLRRWAKILALTLMTPVLALSLFGLSTIALFEIPAAANHRELSRELCAIQQGQYSVHLLWEETAGGAVGPHGVGVEQRRTILPGLYAVRYLDYFEGASRGSLTAVAPDKVELYIPIAGYEHDQKDLRRVYSLKPRLYF